MVFRVIDVLVSSFAYSLKIGSYSKGETVKSEPATGVDSRIVPSSGFSTSDSKHNANFKKERDKFPDINSSSGNVDRESIAGAEASRTVDHSVPSESQQPLNANVSEPQESQVTSVAIPPDEPYSFVFAFVEEEMIADASYLFSIIVEFIRSTNLEKIKLHPSIYIFSVRLLARNERYAELGLLIINKVRDFYALCLIFTLTNSGSYLQDDSKQIGKFSMNA